MQAFLGKSKFDGFEAENHTGEGIGVPQEPTDIMEQSCLFTSIAIGVVQLLIDDSLVPAQMLIVPSPEGENQVGDRQEQSAIDRSSRHEGFRTSQGHYNVKRSEKVGKAEEKRSRSSQKPLGDSPNKSPARQTFQRSSPCTKRTQLPKYTSAMRQMEQRSRPNSTNLSEQLDTGVKPKGEKMCMSVDHQVVR
uniref:Uncharacterized protein n=1 Tax=Solanum tuberosum TaxID=4113 RepID=M1DJD7_SOLTU